MFWLVLASDKVSVLALFCKPSGLMRQRVFGPRMFRIASAHVFPDVGVTVAPKVGEILCDLQWTARRGEQVNEQRQLAIHYTGLAFVTEHLLQFYREYWWILGIVDTNI